MKKLFILLVATVCSMLLMAQTQQITWVNGRALMGQSIESIDSLKYGTMTDADQLVLWLPKTIVVHDTIVKAVHDTIIKTAHDVNFYSRDVRGSYDYRKDGQSVRPVCP